VKNHKLVLIPRVYGALVGRNTIIFSQRLFVGSLLQAGVQPTLDPSMDITCRSTREEQNWLVCASVCMMCSYYNSLLNVNTSAYFVARCPPGLSSSTWVFLRHLPWKRIFGFHRPRVLPLPIQQRQSAKERTVKKVADVVNAFLAETRYYYYWLISTVH